MDMLFNYLARLYSYEDDPMLLTMFPSSMLKGYISLEIEQHLLIDG